MQRLKMAGHDALLRREEVIISVAEVTNGAFGRVFGQQIRENPTDAAQSQRCSHFADHLLMRIV